jgi:hypothetical protein
MNVDLLLKIKERIISHPASFNMSRWGCKVDPTEEHPCGTIACIAGWAVILTDTPVNWIGYSMEDVCVQAKELLGISWSQANLFYPDYWPSPFKEEYLALSTSLTIENKSEVQAKLAKLAARRIDRFIETEMEAKRGVLA